MDSMDRVEIHWASGTQVQTTVVANEGEITPLSDGGYRVEGQSAGAGWDADWVMELGGADGLSFDVSFDSNMPTTEEFGFSLSVPSLNDYASPSTLTGSTSVNVLDNVQNGDPGATVAAPAGNSSYKALIEGTVWETLLDHPAFSLTAPPFQTNSYGPESFVNNFGPAVSSGDQLEIQHSFTLTGFDTAQFVSTFVVIPEPSCLILLGLGGAMALRRRRRMS